MATKIERCRRAVNDSFSEHLAEAIAKKFDGLEIETSFNLMAMTTVSTRSDGEDFTPEQHNFIEAYDAGYFCAVGQIQEHK